MFTELAHVNNAFVCEFIGCWWGNKPLQKYMDEYEIRRYKAYFWTHWTSEKFNMTRRTKGHTDTWVTKTHGECLPAATSRSESSAVAWESTIVVHSVCSERIRHLSSSPGPWLGSISRPELEPASRCDMPNQHIMWQRAVGTIGVAERGRTVRS